MSSTQPEERTGSPGDQVASDDVGLPSLARSSGSHDETDVTVRDVRLETAVASAGVVIGTAFIILGSQLRQGAIPDPVTTGGMPVGTGIFIIVLSAIVGLRAVKAWRRGARVVPSEGSNDEPGFPASWTRVVVFAVGAMLWTYLLPRVGYILSTPVFLAAALRLFGVRSWMKLTLVPIIFTAVCWYLFGQVLTIRLPWGFLEPWARQAGLIL